MEKIKHMKKLAEELNEAAKVYYTENREVMTNVRYDELYDELLALEGETGIVLAISPTQKVGYEVVSNLPKESHSSKMLSLDKTKETARLKDFLGDKKGVISWKLDGLTIVLTYEEGMLQKAVTRGDGEIGEVVTSNAGTFKNLPMRIPFKGRLVLRGEAVISYKDFEMINGKIWEADSKYKNPRNLCSGSVRQLNSRITAERKVGFYAFALTEISEYPRSIKNKNSFFSQLQWLEKMGFQVVENYEVHSADLKEKVEYFKTNIESNPLPSDGLVLIFDDVDYGKSLGETAKFPRNALAFKWKDQEEETVLRKMEWSASRTGLINPIAVFDTVNIEGTMVSRASVHNLSTVEDLKLGIGDRIKVYKANMIIPQIKENLTKSDNIRPPANCHVCGGPAEIRSDEGVKVIFCTNPDCIAKKLGSFTLLVSRNALNMEFMSEATLDRFINEGFIKEPADLFRLERYKKEIISLKGFGEKSFDKLIESGKKAAHTTAARLLTGLGISGVGSSNAKIIAESCKNRWTEIENLTFEQLVAIDGIGPVIARDFTSYFADEKNRNQVHNLVSMLHIDEDFQERGKKLEGLTFVITGSLNSFKNRRELKEAIESEGGRVSSAVSDSTDYLINNDPLSSSSKNKKAGELGVKIIDEEVIIEFLTTGV